MSLRVYLAGAVELVHKDYARSWREEAKRIMQSETNCYAIDPLAYEDREGPWNDEEIVNTDRYLIRQSDVVLLDGRQPSWGSAIEVAWAHEQGLPVVVWGRSRASAAVFLRYHSTSLYETLREAILDGVAPLGLPNA